ncbi:MAG: LysM peptidoglycan-binding domain-containing protein [Desulfobacterales bacterium]|jgi:hypothetical protein
MNLKNLLTLILIIATSLSIPVYLWAEESSETVPTRESGIADLEVVETESGIYYTVKKGDTLWDISQRFSNSPYLWPDLWSGNSQIANPHRIYPGERIRLFRRQDVERHTQPAPEETPVEATAQVIEEEPEPVLEMEPEPQPQIEPLEEFQEVSGLYEYAAMDQVGFIREKAVKPVGEIFRVQGFKKMLSQNDIVYISFDEDRPLSPGSRYSIYRTFGPIRDSKTRKYIGIQHYMLGTVEIIQTEPEYTIGKIIQSYSAIRVGDLLMPFIQRDHKIVKQESQEGLFGEVIIAEDHNLIIGDYTRVFINKGKEDGVKPGQIYSIYYQDPTRVVSGRKKGLLKPVTIGSVMVLHTEKTTSTVLVTQVSRNIAPGSKIATPFE